MGITADQLKDINIILQNKKDALTQNNYNSISSPWTITSYQNAATSYLNSMVYTTDRTYLWSSYKNMEQGPQLQSTVNNLLAIATAYATTPYKNYTNIHFQNATTLDVLSQALDFVFTTYYKADLAKLLLHYLEQLKTGGSGKQVFQTFQGTQLFQFKTVSLQN
ncbi:N-terminal alpha-helical [Hexamita inflata]|uniref:N-terminal alpha-helical n=1 Tax=Hexamita inflata TaxID=28002 RepID=A0ABP1KTE0_9EUKA